MRALQAIIKSRSINILSTLCVRVCVSGSRKKEKIKGRGKNMREKEREAGEKRLFLFRSAPKPASNGSSNFLRLCFTTYGGADQVAPGRPILRRERATKLCVSRERRARVRACNVKRDRERERGTTCCDRTWCDAPGRDTPRAHFSRARYCRKRAIISARRYATVRGARHSVYASKRARGETRPRADLT